MDDLIRNYIDRVAFASDTEFAKQQLAELEEAYKIVRDSRANMNTAKGTGTMVTEAKQATTAVKEMTAAMTAQNQVVGQSAQILSAHGNSLQQNIVNLNNYKKALDTNKTDIKEANELRKLGVLSEEDHRKKITELTAAQFKYKQAISDTTKEIKNQTQLNIAAPTSILEARTQNKQLTTQRDLLPTSDKEGIAALNALIDRNNKLIDENSDKLAKQKINIGNYGPSVKAALSVLEEELMKINSQLAVTDKNSEAFQTLTKQANLLKSVSTGLDKTFDSTKTELRALEEAAKKVGSEFGITSTQFQKLSTEIGERKDQLKDIQSAINFQSSDTRNLDAIVSAVQAVTGAYGAYQAATVLLGEDSEELQKTMVKLQAVLTLVTSVQAVANSLQSESALIQGALAAKATLLGLAQKIVAIASGEATTALAAESVAAGSAAVAVDGLAASEAAASVGGEAIAATSAEAAIAIEGEAVASGSLAVGLDAVAVSEGAVATGATTMSTAIAATGIGLLIIGLAIAVYKVVQAVKDWNAANASTKKANEELTKSMKDLVDATKVYDDLMRQSTQKQLQSLDNLIAKRKALGVSSAQSLALDKQAADARAKMAADEVKFNGITEESLKKKEAEALISAGNVQAAEELRNKFVEQTSKSKNKDYDRQIKALDENIKKQKERYDLDLALYTNDADKFKAAQDAKQQSALLADQIIKLSGDERRKFIQESAKLEADIQISKNDRILNNDRSTLDERLAALKSNLDQQKKIIQADNKAVQNDPTVSETDKIISSKKANADIAKAESESQIAITKLKEDFRLRDLQATTEIQKRIFDVINQTNTDIYNNDAISEQQRLEALKKSVEARKAILDTQFSTDLSNAGISDPEIERIKQEGFFEIKNKKITNEELKKLIADFNTNTVALAKESATERIKIVKDYYEQYADDSEKALKKIQRQNDLEAEDRTDSYNNQIIDLNNSFSKGLISTEKYNSQRLKLDNDYAKASILIEIDKIEKSLAATVSASEVEKRLKTELASIKAVDVSKQTDDEKKIHADRIKQITDELTKIQDAVGKETELYKQLSKLKKDLSEQDKKTLTDAQQATVDSLNYIKEKANEVFDIIGGFMNASATAQKNRLQAESEAIDKKSAKEIEAINASTLSEQDKAAKIAILNARTQAQKDQIALKQKQIDQEQARAQKAFTIFNIILATALNIAKAGIDIPKAIFAAAIGAAQLAIAVATPIPKFKHGKNNSYEGPAIVGDGGVPEFIKREDGSIQKTPAHDTLTYLHRNDVVYPNAHDMLVKLAMPKIRQLPIQSTIDNDSLYAEMKRQTPLLAKIANKRELHLRASRGGMEAMWKWGASQTKYLDENTNW